MSVFARVAYLTCFAALIGCDASSPERSSAGVSLSEASLPVQLFSEACLETLPEFEGFSGVIEKRGLPSTQMSGGITAYKAPGNQFTSVLSAKRGDKLGCGVGFHRAGNSEKIGALFLQKAIERTGGKPREKFPSSQFEYAYQLKNGSVMTHRVKIENGQTIQIFLISKPVPRDKVAEYIGN